MPAALPLTLTVIPFDSVPISIPIPQASWNTTAGSGAVITFLPLAADSRFIALLEDGNGTAMGAISDVIGVDTSADTSCLPSATAQSAAPFILKEIPSQCESFNVTFNATQHRAPTIQAFVPHGRPFTIKQDPGGNSTGSASYLMNLARGFQVALLFNDNGTRQTSDLLTVGGDSTSSSSCLPKFNATSAAPAKPSGGLSSGGAVAIGVVSGTIVGAMLILLALFFYRERRKRLARLDETMRKMDMESATKDPKAFDSPPISPPTKFSQGQAIGRQNIPRSNYLSKPPNQTYGTSPVTPEFIQRRPPSPQFRTVELGDGFVEVLPPGYLPRRSEDRMTQPDARSISSLDIEGILEAATIGTMPRNPTTLDDASSIRSPGRRSTRPSVNQLRLMDSSGILRTKRSQENLDVPMSATPYGRFSGLSTLEVQRRDPTLGPDSAISLGTISPMRGNLVKKSTTDYMSEVGSIRSGRVSDRYTQRFQGRTSGDWDVGGPVGIGRGSGPSRI